MPVKRPVENFYVIIIGLVFAKRGGGWTTTHLYVHCTFFMSLRTYERTPYSTDSVYLTTSRQSVWSQVLRR